MISGPNADKVAILRRGVASSNAGGVGRSDFAVAFTTWCAWRFVSAAVGVEAALAEDQALLELRVNDNARNRKITIADRARLRGSEYAISTISPPDRVKGEITLRLTQKVGG